MCNYSFHLAAYVSWFLSARFFKLLACMYIHVLHVRQVVCLRTICFRIYSHCLYLGSICSTVATGRSVYLLKRNWYKPVLHILRNNIIPHDYVFRILNEILRYLKQICLIVAFTTFCLYRKFSISSAFYLCMNE